MGDFLVQENEDNDNIMMVENLFYGNVYIGTEISGPGTINVQV